MSSAEIVSLASRWLHIAAAIVAVGGAAFVFWVLLPASGVLAADARAAFHAAARKRWSKIVIAAITVLLVTGLYNFITISRGFRGELPGWYHPIFGVKFLLALVLFFIASLLAGRTALAERLRANFQLWLSINFLLAAVIIALSGVLRTAHPPLPPATGPAPAAAPAEK